MIECGVNALHNHREGGEKFAPSAINWCAMLNATTAQKPGGLLEKITTLLTAAQWWGPDKAGWQQYDRSWNCTDKKNMIGQVVEKQGRLIWSVGDDAARVGAHLNHCESSVSSIVSVAEPPDTKLRPAKKDAPVLCNAQCFSCVKFVRA